MQIKTILNRIHRHRSFIYGRARLVQQRVCRESPVKGDKMP